MYSTEVIPPFSNASSGPILSPVKQPQTIIETRFPLKTGTKQSLLYFSFDVLNTHVAAELRPISILLSSENIHFNHCSNVQSLCSIANCKRLLICSTDKNGLLTAICF